MVGPQDSAPLLRADASVPVLVLDRNVDAHAFEDDIHAPHYVWWRTRRIRCLVDCTVTDMQADVTADNALEPAFGDTVMREGLAERRRCK